MEEEIRIIQTMMYEIFTFYHRLLMILIGRTEIRLGSYFQDYIDEKKTDYDPIENYIMWLNRLLYIIEHRFENTRGTYGMHYIHVNFLVPEYIKYNFIPYLNAELSNLKSNQITLEDFTNVMKKVFFGFIFQKTPEELLQIYKQLQDQRSPVDEEDMGLNDLRNYFATQFPINLNNTNAYTRNYYVKNNVVIYEYNKYSSPTDLEKHITDKTSKIYRKNIKKWIRYVQKQRKKLTNKLEEYNVPRDLYLNITKMAGLPELSPSPTSNSGKQKTKSKHSPPIKKNTQNAKTRKG